MTFTPSLREASSAPLASLFANAPDTWTQDQVILNEEIQRLINRIHADRGCEWDRVTASIITSVKKRQTLCCDSHQEKRSSPKSGLATRTTGYGFNQYCCRVVGS
jgi:hypothetical protein